MVAAGKGRMDFDDSFFEDSDECEEDKSAPIEKVLYTVKRCEPEVSAPGLWRENGPKLFP